MERKYKAFISYRHLPPQMEVAKAVHRRIEHYVVPRNLRKDGARKLGLVFRDQDELPIAGSLSANIQTALDNSEFLIVICTPETSGSEWVLREISYFLEHHDHDHVLAVLADGAPEEAFPKLITEIRGEDGELQEIVEPLAANIIAPTRAKRRKLFQTESLRILAALIGCPYDALYRREQRYRFRRLAIASGVVFALAAAFVGLLLNRNARIHEQLLASQINESKALAALSYSSYRDGDYREALSSALKALPSGENDRPYVADAEYTLVRELSVYTMDQLHEDQSIDQPASVGSILMSRDGKFLATLDSSNIIRVYDTWSGKLLWEKQRVRDVGFEYVDALRAVYAGGELLDAATGKQLWIWENANHVTFSRSGAFAAFIVYSSGHDYLFIADAKTGETLHSCALEGKMFTTTGVAVSDDGKWAAVSSASASEKYGLLQLYDAEQDRLLTVDDKIVYSFGIMRKVQFLENNDLLTAFAGTGEENGGVTLYDREKNWEQRFSTELKLDQSSVYINGMLIMGGSIDFLDFSADKIIFGSLKNLYQIDRQSGEITMDLLLPDLICRGIFHENNSFGLILANGLITGGVADGILTSDVGMFYADTGYSLSKGAIGGETYRKGVFAVVNKKFTTTITIFRWQKNEEVKPAAPEDKSVDLSNARIYASPSGKTMAAVTYDNDEKVLSGMIWKEDDPEPKFYSLPIEASFLFDPADISLTEDGRLIAQDYVYDLMNGTVSGLTPSGKTAKELDLYSFEHSSRSVYDRSNKCVMTAVMIHADPKELPQLSLWQDAALQHTCTFPQELYSWQLRYSLCAASADGWAVLTTKDSEGAHPEMASVGYACDLKENRFVKLTHLNREYASACALAEEKPLMAVPNDEGKVLIVSLPDDTVVGSFDIGVPSASVRKMLFVKEDSMLLVFTASGDLLLFDVAGGGQLNRAYFGDRNFSFHDTARYTAAFSADGRQLLITVNDATYTESVIICLETENWNCVGMHISAAHYLQGSNKLVLKPARSDIFYAPFYSREELMAKAKAILERDVLTP